MGNALIAAFDPGKNIGYALVSRDGTLLHHEVLAEYHLATLELPADCTVLLGDGTGSRRLQAHLEQLGAAVQLVDEAGSTLEARQLYYRLNPPRGLQRLLPAGLRWPGRFIDDYAAYALALRYLATLEPSGQATRALPCEKGAGH
jgi:hypothetical protein